MKPPSGTPDMALNIPDRSRAAARLERLHARGPALLSTLVVAALVLDLAHTVSSFRPSHRVLPAPTAASGPGLLAAGAWRGLFGDAPVAVSVAAAPGSLALIGTMTMGDPAHGLAIIRVSGAPGLYTVGGDVGGAQLKEVYDDHVVLDRGGALEVLAMAKPNQDFILGGNGSSSGQESFYERPKVQTVAEIRESMAVATAPIAMVVKARPLMNGPDFRGFIVQPGPDAVTFARLGFKPGDMVMSVNNRPILPSSFDDLAQDMKSGRPVKVFIRRQGEPPMEIKLNPEALAVAAQE